MAGDEENVFTDEYKEHISLTSSYSNTRPETGATARHFLEGSFPSNNEASLEKSSDTKSSTTRPGRNAVIYDEYGNQWDKEEWERKENNPYRWFIEKQREKQMTKGRTLDEEAEGEMVKYPFSKINVCCSFKEAHLRSVTERFCHWLYDLAGEKTEDIEPALVRNLFSTAYDTKPSLSAPIKIVETTRVISLFILSTLLHSMDHVDSTRITRRCSRIDTSWIRPAKINNQSIGIDCIENSLISSFSFLA